MFADVYVSYPLEGTFTYKIPDDVNVEIGRRVRVNFAGRNVIAYVSKTHNIKPVGFKIKNIIDVIDDEPIFDKRLIELAHYIASGYICNAGEVLSLALPSGLKPSKRYKNPFELSSTPNNKLTDEQNKIYNKIFESYGRGKFYHLLFGITGSGKTEVYIDIARYFLRENRSIIYLVPEISISSQIFQRLFNIFGDELILYHSHLTINQRLHNWKKFYSGEAKIVVGTRSAVFLQCPDLGAIIVDEEHDESYKENSTPRYNAKRIAFYRSKKEKALLLFGSATPSIELLFAAEKGVLGLHILKQRYGDANLPEVEIVKIKPGKPSEFLSTPLKLFTKRAVDNGNQAIYLLNRRGFSPFVICNSCSKVVECPNCSISLNYHMSGDMMCHYCGYKRRIPDKCDSCSSEGLVKFGSGTQRMEEIIKNNYRDYRIFRLDQDSARKKDTVYDLVEKMKAKEIDILIGTQMVAKGFDFHDVTVIGVLCADIGLNIPDFRASERIFSLLVQVSGRSGRGENPGKVILQTLDENHNIFNYIKKQDYYGFYKSELEIRKTLGYPPFSRIARLLIRGIDEKNVIDSINALKDEINRNIKKTGMQITLLGPSSAPITKIARNFRHHIILKSKGLDNLIKLIKLSKNIITSKNVYLEIDIDPNEML